MSLTYKQPKDNMRASLNTSKSTIKNNLAADILDYRFDGMAGSYLDVYFSVPFGKAPIPKNVTGVHLVTKGNVVLGSSENLIDQDTKSLADAAMDLIQSQSIKTYLIGVKSSYFDNNAIEVKKVAQRAVHHIHAVGAALTYGFALSYETIKNNIIDSTTRGEEIIVGSSVGDIHFVESIKELKPSSEIYDDYNNLTNIIENSISESINDETRHLLRANELVLVFELFKTDYGSGYEYGVGQVHLITSNTLLLASVSATDIGVGRILSQVSAGKSYQKEMAGCVERLVAKAYEENGELGGSAPITSEVKPPLFALMNEL